MLVNTKPEITLSSLNTRLVEVTSGVQLLEDLITSQCFPSFPPTLREALIFDLGKFTAERANLSKQLSRMAMQSGYLA